MGKGAGAQGVVRRRRMPHWRALFSFRLPRNVTNVDFLGSYLLPPWPRDSISEVCNLARDSFRAQPGLALD